MWIPHGARAQALLPRDSTTLPAPQDVFQVNPTLLVSWWCTLFSLVIILIRLCGRYIRTETWFREDKIMALGIIPLLGRMALVHVIIRWGTNNVDTTGLSADDLYHRRIGSMLVLPARILYAAFLWNAKFTVSEFLKRTYSQMWKRSYEWGLQAIRWFLMATFVGIVIATLAECRPFHHYWRVVPDPGPHCRQASTQLWTMGSSNIVTDLLLVAFPVPIVLASNMRLKRKVSLVLLFGLSLILVAITVFRIWATIDYSYDQPFRSLLASIEILAAAAVSNALVLGSFVRDRGAKKAKFKFGSIGGDSSLDRPTIAKTRPRAALSWGSDIDLVGDLGMRLGPEFSHDKSSVARPAPAVMPLMPLNEDVSPTQTNWSFPARESMESDETDLKNQPRPGYESPLSPTRSADPYRPAQLTPWRMSFFDVGGLLPHDTRHAAPRSPESLSFPSGQNISMQPLLRSSAARERQRSPVGARVFLDDLGGMPDPFAGRRRSPRTPWRAGASSSSSPSPSGGLRRKSAAS